MGGVIPTDDPDRHKWAPPQGFSEPKVSECSRCSRLSALVESLRDRVQIYAETNEQLAELLERRLKESRRFAYFMSAAWFVVAILVLAQQVYSP